MAMLKHLDDGVGDVVGKQKKESLFDSTILFFSDRQEACRQPEKTV